MSEPRKALEAVEALAARYKAMGEQLEAAVAALREVVDAHEFAEQRREAIELARPHLSDEALAALGAGAPPAAPRRRQERRWFSRSQRDDQGWGD